MLPRPFLGSALLMPVSLERPEAAKAEPVLLSDGPRSGLADGLIYAHGIELVRTSIMYYAFH